MWPLVTTTHKRPEDLNAWVHRGAATLSVRGSLCAKCVGPKTITGMKTGVDCCFCSVFIYSCVTRLVLILFSKNMFWMGVNGTKKCLRDTDWLILFTQYIKDFKKKIFLIPKYQNSQENTQPCQILCNLHQYSQSYSKRKSPDCLLSFTNYWKEELKRGIEKEELKS